MTSLIECFIFRISNCDNCSGEYSMAQGFNQKPQIGSHARMIPNCALKFPHIDRQVRLIAFSCRQSPNNTSVIIHKTRGSRALVKRSVSIAVIHVSLCRVSRPGWEWPRSARGTKHGEGQDENHDLSSAIKGAAQDVVVLAVPSRMVATQPEL